MSEARDEIRRLQGCLNDRITVVSLPAIWRDQESSEILSGLLKCLVHLAQGRAVRSAFAEGYGGTASARIESGGW
jgi:hypothetical protein